MSRLFALSKDQAIRELRSVARVAARWAEHFRKAGVADRDIELYAEQIDRPFLKDQRDEFTD
jgi:serine/threonine-protein kinase HipA